MSDTLPLEAPHTLQFDYTRSAGPILGAFLGGLRERRIVGVRDTRGRVLVPPQEYDPTTAADLTELVEVADTGTVTTWAWAPEPGPNQPFDRPFAWVHVRFDGADTAMLLPLDAGSPDEVETGMRVRAVWADEREGRIQDIVAVEPAPDAPQGSATSGVRVDAPVDVVVTPARVDMTYRAGVSSEPFLRGTQQRRLLGRRCSQCGKVYLPPRGVCSMCGAPFTDEQVECGPEGTVATYLVVNVPFANQEIEIPYTAAEVVFDNAHTTSQFLLLGVGVDEVRMGMRVRAVWAEGDDLEPTLSNVTHVEPIDEPDLPYEAYAEFA